MSLHLPREATYETTDGIVSWPPTLLPPLRLAPVPPASVARLSTVEVAGELGITRRRVLALIAAGRLPAQRVGVKYLIHESDLEKVRIRKRGRPRKVRA